MLTPENTLVRKECFVGIFTFLWGQDLLSTQLWYLGYDWTANLQIEPTRERRVFLSPRALCLHPRVLMKLTAFLPTTTTPAPQRICLHSRSIVSLSTPRGANGQSASYPISSRFYPISEFVSCGKPGSQCSPRGELEHREPTQGTLQVNKRSDLWSRDWC